MLFMGNSEWNKNMKGIFLDDERSPCDVYWVSYQDNVEWIVCRNGLEFFLALNPSIDIVSFDHDIQEFHNGKETTGYDILKKMIDNSFDGGHMPSEIYFHTQNNIGKKNMEMYYTNFMNSN